jgi:imidazolonepropionase-like amidohydrolase
MRSAKCARARDTRQRRVAGAVQAAQPKSWQADVVEDGALGDLPRVDGDPIANLDRIADPRKNFVVIMKYGKIYKNTVQ